MTPLVKETATDHSYYDLLYEKALILIRMRMKELVKDTVFVALMAMMAICVNARNLENGTGGMDVVDSHTIYVNLVDGNYVQFVLSEQQPTLEWMDDKMTVFYGDYHLAADQISYERDKVIFEHNQVKDIRFSIPTGIEKISADKHEMSINLSQSGFVRIKGLKKKYPVDVYFMDGKKVSAPSSYQESETVIDLSAKPRGIYIISVSPSFTFKMMKP